MAVHGGIELFVLDRRVESDDGDLFLSGECQATAIRTPRETWLTCHKSIAFFVFNSVFMPSEVLRPPREDRARALYDPVPLIETVA